MQIQHDGFVEYAAGCVDELARLAYVLVGDYHRAQELVQDTLTEMWAHWPKVASASSRHAYVRKMMVNKHVSNCRKRRVKELLFSEPIESADAAASSQVGVVDERDALWKCLERIGHRQRVVLVLRYYADLDDHSIAITLGCRPGTVRSLAARGLTSLKLQIDQEGHTRRASEGMGNG